MNDMTTRPTQSMLFIALLMGVMGTMISGCSTCDDCDPPQITATGPVDAAVTVPTGTNVTATFDKAMGSATINGATFTLTGPGGAAIAGTVTYAPTTAVATFNPTADLANSTLYTATVTTGAQDQQGTALAANHTWSFTTATLPVIVATIPLNASGGVCVGSSVSATFSEPMDPATITTSTFFINDGGGTPVPGSVTYTEAGSRATFTADADLDADTAHTATITTGARDLAGSALADDYIWTFTTGAQACGPATNESLLDAAEPFGNLGGTSGSTNAGIFTVINGDFGSTTTSTGDITGYRDTGGDVYTVTPLNDGLVNALMYTCTVSTTGPNSAAVNSANCLVATAGLADAQDVYDNVISPAAMPGGIDPNAGELGGLTLAPGVYMAAGGSFQVTGVDLVLDAQGDADATFVFQTASSLTVGEPGAPRSVNLINGAQAKNVYWYVGSAATINAAGGGMMVGTIIAQAGVAFSTAGNVDIVTLEGRAIGLTASVTLVNTIINVPAN